MTARFNRERLMSMIGKTLGSFECTALIGKGGMGEVYKAKDQKLGRNVAIKVLPEEFAKDADRVARFQREAKLLASLNHPNIAAIHGLEESDGTHFLVLELIEGYRGASSAGRRCFSWVSQYYYEFSRLRIGNAGLFAWNITCWS